MTLKRLMLLEVLDYVLPGSLHDYHSFEIVGTVLKYLLWLLLKEAADVYKVLKYLLVLVAVAVVHSFGDRRYWYLEDKR